MKKIICWILVINFIFLSGCVEKDIEASKNQEARNYIVYNLGSMPKDLIMFNDYDIRQQDLLANLFEGLVKIDDMGKISPAIAESWTLSKDETCYTFKIRNNAKWSNGTDITAEDFVNFFQQVLNKNTNNIYAEQLYYIFGAENYKNGKATFSDVAIRALDKKNLEIRLNYPCCYFLNILAEPIYGLRNIDDNLSQWEKKYRNILYSGYFTIDSFTKNDEMVLKKNLQYWNKNSVKSDKVCVVFSKESEEALAAFQSSKIDVFMNPPISELKNLVNEGKASEQSSYKAAGIAFNFKKNNIVNDVNLRKAISECIDRESITKNILNDSAKPALSYIPLGISDAMNGFYVNKNFFANNIEKDKALNSLKNSKYNKECLKMIYIDTVENKKICEYIAKNLNDNLGIKLECEGYNTDEFYDELKKDNYDMAKIDYENEYNYPLSFLEIWSSQSEKNFSGYKNIEFDDNLIKAKMEKDKSKKIEILRLGEDILMDNIPIIPIYFYNTVICKKENIKGVYINKKGNIYLDKIEYDLYGG